MRSIILKNKKIAILLNVISYYYILNTLIYKEKAVINGDFLVGV